MGSDGRFSFWDKDARTKLKTSEQLDQPISACCFNHNGNIFAYASSYDWSKVSIPGPRGHPQQQSQALELEGLASQAEHLRGEMAGPPSQPLPQTCLSSAWSAMPTDIGREWEGSAVPGWRVAAHAMELWGVAPGWRVAVPGDGAFRPCARLEGGSARSWSSCQRHWLFVYRLIDF